METEKAKVEKILADLEDHPLTKKIRADEAAETLATRREVAGRIEALRNEQTAIIPKLRNDLKEKEAKYFEAKAATEAAGEEVRAAAAALATENQSFNIDISTSEAALLESADPAIDAAISFFLDTIDELRKPGKINRVGRPTKLNVFTMKRAVTAESNRDAVLGAMGYCKAAIVTLEKTKLLPAVDLERIARLKTAIPKTDVFTEFSGEKAAERINADPRSLLPSDSQMDWTIGKLNEKVKKLLGK